MRFDSESARIRNIEFKIAATVVVLELARTATQAWRLQAISTGTEFDAIHPAVNFILDYTGNLSLGYLFTWAGKDFIPNISEKWKLNSINIASAAVMGGAVVLETLQGQTYWDLPAAAVGIAAYRGLHWYLRRNQSSQPKNTP